MNWEAIGAVGELVGGVAVIATLIYLSLQIRQTNKINASSVRQSVYEYTARQMLHGTESSEFHAMISSMVTSKRTAIRYSESPLRTL